LRGGNESSELGELEMNVDERVGDGNGKVRAGSRCGGEWRDDGDKIVATRPSISGWCVRRGTDSEFEKRATTQNWRVSSYAELVSEATSRVDLTLL